MKDNIIIALSACLAILTGFFAQNLAYLLNEWLPVFYVYQYLTIITVFSILFFVITLLMMIVMVWKQQKKRELYMAIYLLTTLLILFPVLGWTLFVLIMWMS